MFPRGRRARRAAAAGPDRRRLRARRAPRPARATPAARRAPAQAAVAPIAMAAGTLRTGSDAARGCSARSPAAPRARRRRSPSRGPPARSGRSPGRSAPRARGPRRSARGRRGRRPRPPPRRRDSSSAVGLAAHAEPRDRRHQRQRGDQADDGPARHSPAGRQEDEAEREEAGGQHWEKRTGAAGSSSAVGGAMWRNTHATGDQRGPARPAAPARAPRPRPILGRRRSPPGTASPVMAWAKRGWSGWTAGTGITGRITDFLARRQPPWPGSITPRS